jgi:nitroreductase
MKNSTQKKTVVLPNETIQTIYQRRSVRKFMDISVDKNTIEMIVNAGRMAPSAINKQPWQFHVLTKYEDLEAISKAVSKKLIKGVLKTGLKGLINSVKEFIHFPNKANFMNLRDPVFHGAPIVIVISAPKDNEWASIDVGMCAQNMLLAAKSLGLDTCPIGMIKFLDDAVLLKKLNIPPANEIKIAIGLGYGDEQPTPHDRINDNLFYI